MKDLIYLLRDMGIRMNANDNIYEQVARYIEKHGNFIYSKNYPEGVDLRYELNMNIIRERVDAACQNLLHALLIDTENDHNTKDTAKRMAKMYIEEVYAGRYTPRPSCTEFPNAKKIDQIYTVGPITIRSACSHHKVPILGSMWVGIIPNVDGKLLGLSKFSRLADWIFRRPQIQEEATQQYAELLQELLNPRAVGVIVKASHLCTVWRGVQDPDSKMCTSVMMGRFNEDPSAKAEFMNLIAGQGYK